MNYFNRRASAGQCENVIQVAKFNCLVVCFARKLMEFKELLSRTDWPEAPRPKFLRGFGGPLISDTISTPKRQIGDFATGVPPNRRVLFGPSTLLNTKK